MRIKLQIIILFISLGMLMTGCSLDTVFEIINLSNKNINVTYSLNESLDNMIFHKPEQGIHNVYKLIKTKEKFEIDYNSGKSNFSVTETNKIEVKLKPYEVLILGTKRGPYTKDETSNLYKVFNINYLEIENGRDSISLVNGSVELIFSEIKRNEYGILIE